jgi:glyoxylase-like metal-dependent hydrolase (beta-lactamase superfamily II)
MKLKPIETGTFGLDGGAMFGVVPKPLWEKLHPADARNRIEMRARALLVETLGPKGEPRRVLIDCGMGQKWNEKFREMYRVTDAPGPLEASLAAEGLKPSDITDVVLTHLHFDHAGGMTRRDGNELIPTFPNAQVYLQRRNWEHAHAPNEKDRASYLEENYSIYRNEPAASRKLNFLNTPAVDPSGRSPFGRPSLVEETLLPGISVMVSNGHTLGMQVVRVGNVVYCADLIPTAAHVKLPWVMGYDCYPLFVMEEKRELLGRAVEAGWKLFYEHCPFHVVSRLEKNPKGEIVALPTELSP